MPQQGEHGVNRFDRNRARRGLTPENRAQTLPETTTTASNRATNTISLKIVSIGMAGSLLRFSFSVISPQQAPPKRGQSLPEWGLGLQQGVATGQRRPEPHHRLRR